MAAGNSPAVIAGTKSLILHTLTTTTADGAIMNVRGYGMVFLEVRSSTSSGWSAVPATQYGTDAPPTRFRACPTYKIDGGMTKVAGITAAGNYICFVGGANQFYVPVTVTSGTPNLTIQARATMNLDFSATAEPLLQQLVTSLTSLDNKIGTPQTVLLANGVAIRDTALNTYDLQTAGTLTAAQIMQYSRFKVSVYNTHDQSPTVQLYQSNTARQNPLAVSVGHLLYSEAGVVAATAGYLVLQPEPNTGLGSNTTVMRYVPALNGLFTNLHVWVQFATAPTAGTITIAVDMQ